ncbi:uncharacterized protein LOC105179551 [Sesamum indicum]|uniref:Uncharacterized protein LOC105179551 n=1 Tax=Sesamum indicum TaxID=4182 RepID=A0A6I9UPM9_SESIN|nr:uncharacterized protein LOC105179551 [Sesamum indicum]
MVGETVTETWFGNIWKSSRKSISRESERPVLGIMAFEISRLMWKVVNIWKCLAEKQIVGLRREFADSVGIQKLVSGDDDYLMDLAVAEIIENLGSVFKSVVVLGKKCTEPVYHNLERVFDDASEIDRKWHGWRYKLKKMEKKVKKMERFVAVTEQLYQELEVLAELEQSLRRMRAGGDSGQVKLLEFQQKVVWQRQQVKNFQEMSPWIRTYEYVIRLLLRSIFTIVERIKFVCGTKQAVNVDGSNGYEHVTSDCLIRSSSISAFMQTSVYPSETNPSRFAVHLGRSFSNLGLGGDKSRSKNRKSHNRSHSSIFCGKHHQVKTRILGPVGFTGCMTSTSKSPVVENYTPSCSSSFRLKDVALKDAHVPILYSNISSTKVSFFSSKCCLMNAHPSTLGYAALALHYANLIILIEKLASSPHLISSNARDDLYAMLPASIRASLRAKLKTFPRTLALSVAEWSLAVARILEWLSPLAHNMVRWQSERNFERQRLISGSNVLLVQTLYFANQVETEAAIVELLMGLNYLSRFGREFNQKHSRSRAYDGYMFPRDNMYYKTIDHTSS